MEDLKASFDGTLAENESMARVFDADDMLKTAMAENKRLNAVADGAEGTLLAKSGEFDWASSTIHILAEARSDAMAAFCG